MKNKRKVSALKQSIIIVACLIISLVIAFAPDFFASENTMSNSVTLTKENERPVITQDIIGNTKEKTTYYKLYNKGRFIGAVSDMREFNSLIDDYSIAYENDFPGASLGLTQDLFFVEEDAYVQIENKNREIIDYLIKNDLLGIKVTEIEFSTNAGVYEIIYVRDINDFYEARNSFLLNFIDEESLTILNSGSQIASPSEFGTVDKTVSIQEKITFSEAVASPENVFKSAREVYDFLCYGRNTDRTYYTTKEGDTIQAVGYYFGDMSARQIAMLNQDILSSEDQVIAPGTELNVTYYQSPITVVVKKERLAQEIVLPDSPLYVEDETLNSGSRRIDRQEQNGLANALYEETWVNGVIQEGKLISSVTVQEPVQGIIALGTFQLPDVGTGNWGWPTYNPILTCNFTCYYNHGGIDIQNRYNRYDSVLAIDSGVVEQTGYTTIGGYFVRVNHNNGYVTYYGHMRSKAYVSVGQTVARGDILGPIGMTGIASGPHVHLAMYYEGKLINPCSVLACSLLS